MKTLLINLGVYIGLPILAWAVFICLCLAFIPNSYATELKSDEISYKCEARAAQSLKLEKQFADRIYVVWMKQNTELSPAKLYDKAMFTAWYVLRDNGMICK